MPRAYSSSSSSRVDNLCGIVPVQYINTLRNLTFDGCLSCKLTLNKNLKIAFFNIFAAK